ncbi:MAG: nucleotide exchange factor GrpE [Legionella sp.]|nr:nucleotide exchange factor GrpE [Legionella sp.]
MNDNPHNKWKNFKDSNFESEVGSDQDQPPETSSDFSFDADPNEQETTKKESNTSLEHLTYGELEEQLTLTEQKAHENWEKATRALAELDNVRRRAEREVANAHRFGVEKLIIGFLPIADSLEQALQVAAHDEKIAEGIELTMKLLLDTLEKHGVQQLNPMGEPFNPQEHEAMSIQQTDDVPSNSVIAVFQKGYRLHERVIRPARVVVAKGKMPASRPASDA